MKLIWFANFRNHVCQLFAFAFAVFVKQTYECSEWHEYLKLKDVSFQLIVSLSLAISILNFNIY